MNIFRFLDFQVYKDSKKFYKSIFQLTKMFPKETWDLIDQLRRAALSICLNIAEGCAKKSDRDFARFLSNSLGSVNECVAGLDCALEIGLIKPETFSQLEKEAESIANQLGGFIKKLQNRPKSS